MRKLPDAIAKRDLLYVKKASVNEAVLVDYAQSFVEAGWFSDAADFANQAKNKEVLMALRQKSVAEGNSFLFLKLHRLIGDESLPTAELLRCAQRAEELGKFRYAIKAYERLENTAEAERVAALIATDGDRISEAESKVFIPTGQDEIAEEE